MLERRYANGFGYNVKLFEVDTRRATDVKDVESLAGTDITPIRKRLVLDFDDLGLPKIDNFEAMAWGPRLPTGERTLLVVSDDNFWPVRPPASSPWRSADRPCRALLDSAKGRWNRVT